MKDLTGSKVIFPKLSYEIVGMLFEIHTELGNRYQEKYYQRALEVKLKKNKVQYAREIAVDLEIDGEKIGKYFLDFLIDGKIIIELKAKPAFVKNDFQQVLGYLKATGLKLGILVNFYGNSLEYKRVLNSYNNL